ncbi:MAG: hypothetical protein JW733_03070 [Coriobacteriia bacterium]|nr:hypothetical protein [Coriobacteriia bacterium]MBN2839367.1 hypothetical protein [Coriobacteriia bacterium]
MYQESEIVDLLMVIFLTPIMVATYRVIKVKGKEWFAASYVMIAFGFVMTVVEGYIAPDLLNLIEHVTHAFAGGFCLLGTMALFRFARREVTGAMR